MTGQLDQESIDYIAISRLQSAYADVVNRRAWTELAMLFIADAPVTVDTVTRPAFHLEGPRAVGEFIGAAIERFEFFEFVILNSHVEVAPDGRTARARVFMCELRQDRETGAFSQAFGLYQDRYAKIEGRWWFVRRNYQSLARTGRNEILPFPEMLH